MLLAYVSLAPSIFVGLLLIVLVMLVIFTPAADRPQRGRRLAIDTVTYALVWTFLQLAIAPMFIGVESPLTVQYGKTGQRKNGTAKRDIRKNVRYGKTDTEKRDGSNLNWTRPVWCPAINWTCPALSQPSAQRRF